MMTLSIQQRAALARRGIVVRSERQDGTVRCWNRGESADYRAEDLKAMAKPGFADRFTAWLSGRVAQ